MVALTLSDIVILFDVLLRPQAGSDEVRNHVSDVVQVTDKDLDGLRDRT